MFVRAKHFENKDGSRRTYLQLVASRREDRKVRQVVVVTLGRLDELQGDGTLDRLVASLAQYTTKLEVLDALRDVQAEWSKELGSVVVFRRLWETLGMARLLEQIKQTQELTRPVQEAIFGLVLNRILDPESRLGMLSWKEQVFAPELAQVELHHFYRALDFLVAHQEAIEGRLWDRVRTLLQLEVDLVFFDTTTTYFEGRGPEGLAEYGHSKDHRPDERQLVVGLLMTKEGVPVGHRVFPGNTADVKAFQAVLRDLGRCFALRRVVLVCDRGMVSEQTLELVEEAGYEYIVAVKMRKLRSLREVLARGGRYHEVKENLRVKEVWHEGARYVVCQNPEEERRDAEVRAATVAKLRETLKKKGARSLVGNRGYRRFLKMEKGAVQLNEAAIEEEKRYDGKYVLRTNTKLSTEEVAVGYRTLWRVERAFRALKDPLELRPVYVRKESRVRGHVMVCFLALVLESTFLHLVRQREAEALYAKVLSDLRQVQVVKLKVKGTGYLVRTELQGQASLAFQAVGVRPPDRVIPISGQDDVVVRHPLRSATPDS